MKCKHSLQIGQLNRVFGVNKGFTGFYLGSNAVPNNTRLISRADNGAVSPGSVSPGFLFETGWILCALARTRGKSKKQFIPQSQMCPRIPSASPHSWTAVMRRFDTPECAWGFIWAWSWARGRRVRYNWCSGGEGGACESFHLKEIVFSTLY